MYHNKVQYIILCVVLIENECLVESPTQPTNPTPNENSIMRPQIYALQSQGNNVLSIFSPALGLQYQTIDDIIKASSGSSNKESTAILDDADKKSSLATCELPLLSDTEDISFGDEEDRWLHSRIRNCI
jgi:hypothetical protein